MLSTKNIEDISCPTCGATKQQALFVCLECGLTYQLQMVGLENRSICPKCLGDSERVL